MSQPEQSAFGPVANEMRSVAEALHAFTTGSPGIRVAVLDGPVDASHPALAGSRLTMLGATSGTVTSDAASQHGTHVAGIIFGQEAGTALGGLAPGCSGVIVPIFAPGGEPTCSQTELARAMSSARAAGAHIINISAGQFSRDVGVHPDLAAEARTCVRDGVLVIAAAGESGCREPQLPARFTDVLAVAAGPANWAGRVPDFSEAPTRSPDTGCLMAPGTDIPGPAPGGGTAYASGSSYAAAIVSGVAALLMSLQAQTTGHTDAAMVREALVATATWDAGLRAARLNAAAALSHLTNVMARQPDAGHHQPETITRLNSETPPPASHRSPVASQRPEEILERVYAVSAEALRDKFAGVAAERFGTIDIRGPHGAAYNVADLRYPLPSGALGMRLVPAFDAPQPGMEDPGGWSDLDAVLRCIMGLAPGDPLYAIISYIHPEEHSAQMGVLPHTSKLTAGHRHVGAYVGQGRTTHALARGSRWRRKDAGHMGLNVDRHPANIQVLSLQGADQATLNRNLSIVDEIVSGLGRVRNVTDNLDCRAVDVATALQYYRDLLRGADYLEDMGWYVNCSAQKAVIVNVGLNLPHDESSFREVFGPDGAELWQTLLARYEQVTGSGLPRGSTSFVPLWKLAGLPVDQVRPMTAREYHAYHAACEEARLDDFPGRRPPPTNAGLAWPLETLPDLLSHFLDTYIGTDPADGLAAAGEAILLRQVLSERLGYPEREYLDSIVPVVGLLLAREAAAAPAPDGALQHLTKARGRLLEWLAEADVLAPAQEQSGDMGVLAERCGQQALAEFTAASRDNVSAGEHLERRLEEELVNMRDRMAPPGGRRGFFASPGIFHQLAAGIHPASPFIAITTACTVMDAEDLLPHSTNPPPEHPRAHHHPISLGDPAMEEPIMRTPNATAPPAAPTPVPTTPGNSATGDDCPTCAANADPDGLGQGQLVYALGEIAYDFRSRGRRDSIAQRMPADRSPENPSDMADHLDQNPFDAAALQWILTLEGSPIYALEPIGPFASDTLGLMRRFLREQLEEGVARVSVPGTVLGTTTHKSGVKLPVITPEARGMYSWTTEALVASVTTDADNAEAAADVRSGVGNFLERVYYELRNLGRQPWERALNFAATNAFEVERIYENAYRENMELDTIEAVPATLYPDSTTYWDIKLVFFFPERPTQTVRRVYRFTVNVEDVVPSTVGPMRSWSIR